MYEISDVLLEKNIFRLIPSTFIQRCHGKFNSNHAMLLRILYYIFMQNDNLKITFTVY